MNYTGEHSVIIHLAPALRSGVIQYMGKHDLDKQYAVLSLLLKSMRSEGLIADEDYLELSSRYSKTVSSLKTERKLTSTQLQEQQKIDEETRYFSMVLDQWHIHGQDWRQKKVKEAESWKDKVSNAKLVIELGAGHK